MYRWLKSSTRVFVTVTAVAMMMGSVGCTTAERTADEGIESQPATRLHDGLLVGLRPTCNLGEDAVGGVDSDHASRERGGL